MSTLAINLENLSKCYHIEHLPGGEQLPKYNRLNEEVGRWLKTLGQRLAGQQPQPGKDPRHETFWALRDITFSINQGERVGIIGRNGAGKSTLLKLLSRITTPTTGRFQIRGTVASLLEVGTGFHPELTGRENIYLNGSILGMPRNEITRKFDEIVEFSGVERFLDTPVKRYSSGMQVRLAFSIAAHLQSEVMIIDEVLAVGDARFRKKCLGKMSEMARDGDRTILFVSHSMNQIESLCSRAIYLEAGEVLLDTPNVRDAIDEYISRNEDGGQALDHEWTNPGRVLDNPWFRPLYLRITSAATQANHEPVTLEMEVELKQSDPRLMLGVAIFSEDNQLVALTYATDLDPELPSRLQPGPQRLRCALPTHFFNEGRHRVELAARIHQGDELTDLSRCPAAVHFAINGGLSDSPYFAERRPGFTAPLIAWEA